MEPIHIKINYIGSSSIGYRIILDILLTYCNNDDGKDKGFNKCRDCVGKNGLRRVVILSKIQQQLLKNMLKTHLDLG